MLDTKATGKIVITWIPLPFGTHRCEFHWEGNGIALVSGRRLQGAGVKLAGIPKVGDVLHIGPFRVRVVDLHWASMDLYVVRDNLHGWLHYSIYRASHVFDGIYRRLILTLYVWGLADLDEHSAAIPTANDIRWVKRFKQWRAVRASRK